MVEEAGDVIARAKSGERFNEDYVELLEQYLEAKASDQGGKELANTLREVQRSWLAADIKSVSDRTLKGERVPEFLIDYLRGRAIKMGLEDKSTESEGGELKRPAL